MSGMVKQPALRGLDLSVPARSGLSEIAVIIPAWQPDQRLVELLEELRASGITHLVVVNDGSSPRVDSVFRAVAAVEGVTLCRHEHNLGKGRALKTAFRHVLATMPNVKAVVTADADGQHLPADILRVAWQLARTPDRAALGVRGFTGNVPFRSRWGNALTGQVFALVTGYPVSDTQTGLRGLPLRMLPELLRLPGERYEYEMVMLAHLCQADENAPVEVPIATVYLEGNRSSHFDPLRDPLRVYGALFRVCSRRWKHAGRRTEKTDKRRLRPA